MKIPPRLPNYPFRPIGRLASLSAALQIPLPELQRLAEIANSQYRPAAAIRKADGTLRETFDARPKLKKVQRKIQLCFLRPVLFPDYVTGSIKGSDAVKNARQHAGAQTLVSEDVANFFPSTTALLVESIWSDFFRFSPDVSELLSKLTSKDGCLPQGAVTSSYLANLAFWNREPALQQRLAAQGITYTRYVDDVTVSSRRQLSNDEITTCIAQVYGMMFGAGMKPKRSKQQIGRGAGQLVATKLVVNRHPALPAAERHAIRAAVHQLEKKAIGDLTSVTRTDLNSVSGRVGRLRRMHPHEGEQLKTRVAKLRAMLNDQK